MNQFFLGVNYWASHAGADMWRNWQEDVVKRDLKLLAEHGIEVLRVFPNWRDFQPVEPMFGAAHRVKEYRMVGDSDPENPYYLDEVMLGRFARFCEIAEEQGLRLIVGLITGWMSGRLYIPPALYGKNIYTDPEALFFQQKFVQGFVRRMKGYPAVLAWDLGNECNCMDQAPNREAAYAWSAMISNAIRAADPDRQVVSGMHSLRPEGTWTLQDQGEISDMLTTHPYPLWVPHCQLTPINHFRTLLHATAQTQYYASVGGKPCLVEEIGSMGPMICTEEIAGQFLWANLWSNWANGSPGVMWWCAFEQTALTAPPYDWNMCERELGMVDGKGIPKPTLLQMKRFRKELDQLKLDLPEKQTDAVCILTKGQDHWGTAYMSYILGKQAGLTLSFSYCDQPLPESQLYIVPSVHMDVMNKKNYFALKEKVHEGATLLISIHDGFLTEFEELTGFRVEVSHRAPTHGTADYDGVELPYRKEHQIKLNATRAQVLLRDQAGDPLFGVADYGKGKVYFLDFPMEEMLLKEENGFDKAYYKVYGAAAASILQDRPINRSNPFVGLTLHKRGGEEYAVLVNYTKEPQDPGLIIQREGLQYEVLYGNVSEIQAFDAAILKLRS